MTTYLMWTDFETTGLNPQMDTILEVAWTLTDAELNMLTPLRSRLCSIDPGNRRRDANLYPEHPLREVAKFDIGNRADKSKWNHGERGHWELLPEIVQHMHDMSGLRDALENTANDPVASLSMVTTANGLWRLIADDLASVGYDFTEDSLVLAGAGVSHFDNRVFAHHMPSRFPLAGGRTGYAYWQHDVSVAARVIGENTWGKLKSQALELPPTHPIYRANNPDAAIGNYFVRDRLVGHRAGDDVAQALIDGRILRAATVWSVK